MLMRIKQHQTALNRDFAGRYAALRLSADAVAAAAALLLGLLLCLVGSGLMAQWKDSSARQQQPGVEELLAAAAGMAGAGIVAWWFLSLACAAATAFLARTGRTRAAAASRKFSPAFMQRLMLAALSVQLLSGPVAHASVPAPGPAWAPTQGHSTSAPASHATATAPVSVQSPPAGTEALSGAGTRPGKEAPAGNVAPVHTGTEPVVVEARATSTPVHPGWQPVPPVVNPGMLAAPATRVPPEAATAELEGVTVQAGDTLWDIAARHLGHGASDLDVALQWPRWYQANLALIGQNPDVLLPGQILQPPSHARK